MTRVTSSMMHSQLLQNLNANLARSQNLQNQLSTNRRINKPSDDPVGIAYSMRYRSELSLNDQHERNVDDTLSWLDYTDSMLGQAGNVLGRIRELAVNGSNGSNPPSAMDAIKSEMEQLYEQLVNIGNSEFNGKYVFNGELTDVKPYQDSVPYSQYPGAAALVKTDDGHINFEIGVGVKIPVNVTGEQVFGGTGDGDNAFKVISDIIGALGDNDPAKVSSMLQKLDTRTDKFLEVRADLGAKTNRVELAQERLKDINVNLTTLQSKVEDADMAEVITNLKMSENVYQSSLAVGSKLITPSLIDFLR